MPQEAVVSPSPIGAARIIEWWHTEHGTEYSGVMEKPAPNAVVGIAAGSPVGLTDKAGAAIAQGADGLFIREVQLGGAWGRWLHMRGSILYRPHTSLCIVRPGADFRWTFGRFVWESVVQWDAAPGAGVDSGIGFYPVSHTRCRAGSLQGDGMYIGNVGGVLTFVSRGNGGYEEVDVSANANPLASGNRVTLMLRNATKSSDAAVVVLVNGVVALTRFYTGAHKLPKPVAALGGWYPTAIHAEAVGYMRMQEFHYYAGPDVEVL